MAFGFGLWASPRIRVGWEWAKEKRRIHIGLPARQRPHPLFRDSRYVGKFPTVPGGCKHAPALGRVVYRTYDYCII
jgi:hypothetical protein